MTNELFFVLVVTLLLFGILGIFFAFQRRLVSPIVIITLIFFASGGWGIVRLATESQTPRNDPSLEAHGIYVPVDTTPTAMEALGTIFMWGSIFALMIAGGFGAIVACSSSERNRLRKEMRSYYRPHA